jgi:acylphosphatase
MTTTRGFRVRGRVQGVGFRWWTRTQAMRLGLAGAVRNHPDGTVEVLLRGAGDMIEEMERLLWQGPPGAEPTAVEPIDGSAAPVDGFHVTH